MGLLSSLAANSLGLALVSYCLSASAAPSPTEKAAAEALFQDGVALLQQSKAEAACAKFAASQELDRALGTMLRLADCYDRTGKTASAWALFEEAASVAQARGEHAREVAARERAADVSKRLSRIKVQVANDMPNGLSIKLNGTSIPRASWDGALPVDPGEQAVEASAPGFESWTGHVNASPGPALTEIIVPALKKSAAVAPVPSSTPAAPGASPKPTAAGASTRRTGALLLGGVGIVSLTVAGITSYLATARNHDSRNQCRSSDPNLCNQQGLDLRNQALDLAKVSTVTAIAGGALLAGGVTWLLLTPSSASPQARASAIRLSAHALPDRALVSVESPW